MNKYEKNFQFSKNFSNFFLVPAGLRLQKLTLEDEFLLARVLAVEAACLDVAGACQAPQHVDVAALRRVAVIELKQRTLDGAQVPLYAYLFQLVVGELAVAVLEVRVDVLVLQREKLCKFF